MTLLESLIASVLLAVTAIVCLDATRGAAQLQRRSEAYTAAVSLAESELALASTGARDGQTVGSDSVRVVRRPWPASPERIDIVEVDVPLAGGGRYRVSRLVERRP